MRGELPKGAGGYAAMLACILLGLTASQLTSAAPNAGPALHVVATDYDVWTDIPSPLLNVLVQNHEPWQTVPFSDCEPHARGDAYPCTPMVPSVEFTNRHNSVLTHDIGSFTIPDLLFVLNASLTEGDKIRDHDLRYPGTSMATQSFSAQPCFTTFIRHSRLERVMFLSGTLARSESTVQSAKDTLGRIATTVEPVSGIVIVSHTVGVETSRSPAYVGGAQPLPTWRGRYDEPCCEPIGKQVSPNQTPCCGFPWLR